MDGTKIVPEELLEGPTRMEELEFELSAKVKRNEPEITQEEIDNPDPGDPLGVVEVDTDWSPEED